MKTTFLIILSIILLNPLFTKNGHSSTWKRHQDSSEAATLYQQGDMADDENIKMDHQAILNKEKEVRQKKQVQVKRRENSRIHSYLERLI
ncbi:MAG: hypothetical protein A3F16_00405 [Deltaproteobacteria bacterium RIFCSPHIGHO2_12_FULL_43_9]|nr:MAG: hypothetical protein A3F16_00405 [Deltaproteobacteria bacterium RIFCSPHIGHO2_12_FULL_43_9]